MAMSETGVGECFDRITFHPAIMGGRACIRGMRITVAAIVDQIAQGARIEDVLAAYPYLERADVEQALAYAAETRVRGLGVLMALVAIA